MSVDQLQRLSPVTELRQLLLAIADGAAGDVATHDIAVDLLGHVEHEPTLLLVALESYVVQTLSHRRRDTRRLAPGTSRWERAAEELQVYRERIHLGEMGYRALGDCSAADLHAAAQARFRLARDIERRGDQLGRLAHLLEKRNAATVRDLPVETVMEIVYA